MSTLTQIQSHLSVLSEENLQAVLHLTSQLVEDNTEAEHIEEWYQGYQQRAAAGVQPTAEDHTNLILYQRFQQYRTGPRPGISMEETEKKLSARYGWETA